MCCVLLLKFVPTYVQYMCLNSLYIYGQYVDNIFTSCIKVFNYLPTGAGGQIHPLKHRGSHKLICVWHGITHGIKQFKFGH